MDRVISSGDGAIDGDDLMFALRVARLDPDAPVLVRGGKLWASLPIGALAVRELGSELDEGVYRAAEVAAGQGRPRPDLEWRSRLPRGKPEVIETVPAAEIAEIGRQAAEAMRQRLGKGIGERRLRDAMLDHVALTIEHGGETHHVQFRLLAALMRMNFLGDDPVRVVRAGRRIGLAGTFGTVWERERGLPLL